MQFSVAFCLLFAAIVSILQPSLSSIHEPYKERREWQLKSLKLGTSEHVDHLAQKIIFHVAMKYRRVKDMEEELLAVSTPSSPSYGKHLSVHEIRNKYSDEEEIQEVVDYFSAISESNVHVNTIGSIIEVTAKVADVQRHLSTTISPYKLRERADSGKRQRVSKKNEKVIYKASSSINISDRISDKIAFTTLNTPEASDFTVADGSQSFSMNPRKAITKMSTSADNVSFVSAYGDQVFLFFQPYCHDYYNNSLYLNYFPVPCNGNETFSVKVEAFTNLTEPNYAKYTNAIVFETPIAKSQITCFYQDIGKPCLGLQTNLTCVCFTTISQLPLYDQLKATITSSYNGTSLDVGSTDIFVCAEAMTNEGLHKLYDIPAGLTVRHGSNNALVEFDSQFFSNEDLSMFLALSGLKDASVPNGNVFGREDNQDDPGGEASLDVQMIKGIAPGADTFFYIYETFLGWLTAVGDQVNPPMVQSVSYGGYEAFVDSDYLERCDQEFMTAGLRGVTIIFASGDQGVIGYELQKNVTAENYDLFCSSTWAGWPASSAYVTAVGATQLSDEYLPLCQSDLSFNFPPVSVPQYSCSGTGEVMAKSTTGGAITSGGGFSDVFPRPSWQDQAVSDYLSNPMNPLPPSGYFNPGGRGYPDISAFGGWNFVFLDGSVAVVGGTSESTPIVAGMVTLFNDIRAAYGMPPMGFINPFLYQAASSTPEAFNDIVVGVNNCGDGPGYSPDTIVCCPYGFSAQPGWDATTGLGSPNFQTLAQLAINTALLYPSIIEESPDVSNNSDDDEENRGIAISGLVLSVVLVSGLLASAGFYLLNYRKSVVTFHDSRSAGSNPMNTDNNNL